MSAVVELIPIIGGTCFILIGLAGLAARRRGGTEFPRWVHVIALVSAGVGIWLAWESQRVGETELWRDALMPIVLPAFTYIAYGFYGAARDSGRGMPDDVHLASFREAFAFLEKRGYRFINSDGGMEADALYRSDRLWIKPIRDLWHYRVELSPVSSKIEWIDADLLARIARGEEYYDPRDEVRWPDYPGERVAELLEMYLGVFEQLLAPGRRDETAAHVERLARERSAGRRQT